MIQLIHFLFIKILAYLYVGNRVGGSLRKLPWWHLGNNPNHTGPHLPCEWVPLSVPVGAVVEEVDDTSFFSQLVSQGLTLGDLLLLQNMCPRSLLAQQASHWGSVTRLCRCQLSEYLSPHHIFWKSSAINWSLCLIWRWSKKRDQRNPWRFNLCVHM